jgi:hypothetical protein
VYKTPDNLSSERVNGGQRIKLQRGVVTGRHSEEFPRRQRHEIRLPPSCPSAGKVAISMELRPRDGFFITWTHNPSARASCRGTIERELGWPAQRVDPRSSSIPHLTAPRQSRLTEGLSYQARAQPLPRPNHQRKSSPKQHINRHRPFERTNYGSPHPWPMPSNEQKTEHRRYE